MKAYKNYIFDFYGTLVDIKTDEEKLAFWQTMSDLYNTYGCQYQPIQLKERYHQLVKEVEEKLAQSSPFQYVEIDLQFVFIQLLEEAIIPLKMTMPKDLTRFGQVVASTFRQQSRELLKPYQNTLSSLEELKKTGARLFVLSNAQAMFTLPEIQEAGCSEFLDKIYISSDYQLKKPDPVFLQMLISENQLILEDTVMVGNDLTTDIAVAHALGMDAVLLNTFPYSMEDIESYRNKGWGFEVIEDIAELLS